MAHDTTKILMGVTASSDKSVESYAGAIDAGKIVRLKSDGTIVVTAADGQALGISLGKSLSDTSRTAVCRRGLRVPVLLTAAFSPTVGAQVNISDTTGLAIAAGAGATGMNAVYATGAMKGISESDGVTEVDVALIDMPGGL